MSENKTEGHSNSESTAAGRAHLEQVIKDFVNEHIDIEAGILGARLREKPGKPIYIEVNVDPHFDCQEAHPLPKEYHGMRVATKVDMMRMKEVHEGYSVNAVSNNLVKRRSRRE
ncbi:MAG: hypothetical protein C0508_20180 [Cyanobacteria bacterium PR.023]|jgi:hypothetical protein|nr:hypothetical protein [Cyanobacteria bacterium PR.023]